MRTPAPLPGLATGLPKSWTSDRGTDQNAPLPAPPVGWRLAQQPAQRRPREGGGPTAASPGAQRDRRALPGLPPLGGAKGNAPPAAVRGRGQRAMRRAAQPELGVIAMQAAWRGVRVRDGMAVSQAAALRLQCAVRSWQARLELHDRAVERALRDGAMVPLPGTVPGCTGCVAQLPRALAAARAVGPRVMWTTCPGRWYKEDLSASDVFLFSVYQVRHVPTPRCCRLSRENPLPRCTDRVRLLHWRVLPTGQVGPAPRPR